MKPETMPQMKTGFLVAAAALAGPLLAANLAAAETRIAYANDWRWEGPAAPFLLALDRGYYAEEGLSVTMDTGQGSLEAIPRVASGTYQMGFADINSLIRFRDQNPELEVKAVLMVYSNPAFAIVGRKSLGIETPQDLEGKTLGAPATDGAFAQWAAFVDANGIDASTVTIENVGFPVREPMLAQGQVDAVTGFSFSSFINLRGAGVPEEDITVLQMSDWGLELYGNVVIVNPDFAAESPEAVEGFIRATIRGLRETIDDPAAATEHVTAHNDVVTHDVELERLMLSLDGNYVTEEVRANGFGGIDEARFDRAVEQIALTYAFQNAPPEASEIFDASYLPPQEERMLE
ncbi:ABC transporter substrate-binding protein [soil metagenome]